MKARSMPHRAVATYHHGSIHPPSGRGAAGFSLERKAPKFSRFQIAFRPRAKLLSACAGFAVAGAALTCMILVNANRRAAVLSMFQEHVAEKTSE